jgi:hypothetical protein
MRKVVLDHRRSTVMAFLRPAVRLSTSCRHLIPSFALVLSNSTSKRGVKTASIPPTEVAEPTEEQDDDLDDPRSENWRVRLPATPEQHKLHREKMKKSFPGGWDPPRKLSRNAMDSLRDLHAMDPSMFSTPVLAERFMISPEAVRRVLRGKWQPSDERRQKLLGREERLRHDAIQRREANAQAQLDDIERAMAQHAAETGAPVRRELAEGPRGQWRRKRDVDKLTLV